MAAPISLSLFIPQMSFLANTIFLGRLGEAELGVHGLTGIYYMIFSLVGYGLSAGLQILYSRRAGEGDMVGLGKTLKNGLILVLLLAALLSALCLSISPWLFGTQVHDPHIAGEARRFMEVRTWGLPFLMINQWLSAYFISRGRSRWLIASASAQTLCNIGGDYMLIFGKGGVPALGLMGAAYGSILGEIGGGLVLVSLFLMDKQSRGFVSLSLDGLDRRLMGRTLSVASPLIVQFLFSIGGWQLFFLFVEHLGGRELAASQILRSVIGILSIGTWALATTCNTLVSNIIGQGKSRLVFLLVRKIAGISLIYALMVTLGLGIFSDSFLGLFRPDPELVEFMKPTLWVILPATWLMSISTILFNAVVGTGNTWINLCIEVSCVTAYLVYCWVVIENLALPLPWAWGSEYVYWGVLFLLSGVYLRSGKWKGRVI